MEFDPAFPILAKFNVGLHTTSKTESDVRAVSRYLGVELSKASLDEHVAILSAELSDQNGFLSANLESDAIYGSSEYRRSLFVREIVANNRKNRQA